MTGRDAWLRRQDDREPEVPAEVMVENNEEGIDDVEGPATPPPDMWGNRRMEGPRPNDPWMEMEAIIGDLWEAGQEFTVYMLIRHLDLILENHPTDRVRRLVGAYGDGLTRRIAPPAWWAAWMDDLLRRCHDLDDAAPHALEGDETGFMQSLGGGGHRRPGAWSNVVGQLRDYPTSIPVVLRRIAAWIRSRLDEQGPCLVALGSMLRDINSDGVVRCIGNSDMDREVGCQVADAMIANLTMALQDGSLHQHEHPAMVGPATREAAMDLSVMADRRFESDMIAVNDSWGNAMEQEEVQVGIMITRWIRARLPHDPAGRQRLHEDIMNALRKQVMEECRHLRRLHMALTQAETMGIEQEATAITLEEPEVPRDAQDLVDQIVMNIGRDTKKRTVAEMWRAEGASSSSSRGPPPEGSHGTLYQECESLRRWLNGVYEGSLSSLAEDAQAYMNAFWGTSGGSGEGFVSEEELREEGETEIEQEVDDEEDPEEVALVQGRPGPSRRGGRERWSPTEPRRSWRSASAAGWGANGSTGTDGNEHRPWRRDASQSGAEGAGASGMGSSERPRRAPARSAASRGREAASCGRSRAWDMPES